MIEGKKIFITGGAGFIGSILAGKLLDRNEVTIFDNFSRDTISGTDFADHRNLSGSGAMSWTRKA
jgi:UDP-glucose 4-epimerase